MNDKIKSFAGKSVVQAIRRGGSSNKDSLISVSKAKGSVLNFSIHQRAVSKLGWQKGDQIELCILEDGALALQRSQSLSARMLTDHGGSGSRRLRLRYKVVPEFYYAIEAGDGTEVEIDGGIIAFVM